MNLIFEKKKVSELQFADLFAENKNGNIYHCLEQPEITNDGGWFFIWYEDLKTKTGNASCVRMDKEIYIHKHNEEFHETGNLIVPLNHPVNVSFN